MVRRSIRPARASPVVARQRRTAAATLAACSRSGRRCGDLGGGRCWAASSPGTRPICPTSTRRWRRRASRRSPCSPTTARCWRRWATSTAGRWPSPICRRICRAPCSPSRIGASTVTSASIRSASPAPLVRQPARRRRRPGRQHDHPAGGEEPVPDAGAHDQAQGAGTAAGAVAGAPLQQGPDPRDLPQPRLFRRRHLRRRRGVAQVLRPAGDAGQHISGGDAGRPAEGALAAQPAGQPGAGARAAPATCWPTWSTPASSTRRRREAAWRQRDTSLALRRVGPNARYFVDWVMRAGAGFVTAPDQDLTIQTTLDAACSDRRGEGRTDRWTARRRRKADVGQAALVAMTLDGRCARWSAASTTRRARSIGRRRPTVSRVRRSSRSSMPRASRPGFPPTATWSTRRCRSPAGSRRTSPTAISARSAFARQWRSRSTQWRCRWASMPAARTSIDVARRLGITGDMQATPRSRSASAASA